MIALPAPQAKTLPLVLSARLVASLGPGSLFDFGKVAPVPMQQVVPGVLYRVLGYSFATELPQSTYSAALVSASPLSWQVFNTGNQTDIFAKPIPVPIYQQDTKILQYFPIEQPAQILARVVGVLDGNSPDLIGYATVAAVLSLTIQGISDTEWRSKYELGEI